MSYSVVLTQVVMLFLMIMVGFFAGRAGIVKSSVSRDLTSLLIKVAIPLLVFSAMIREKNPELVKDSLLSFSFAFIFFAAALILADFFAKALKIKKGRRSIWMLAVALSNTGFMGFPVVSAIFGAEGLFLATMINMAFNLVGYIFGGMVCMKDAGAGERIRLKPVLLSNINIGMFLGLLFFAFQLPLSKAVFSAADSIGSIVTPLSMMITGLNMANSNLKDIFGDVDVYTASLFRLILMPLLAYAIVLLLPIRDGSLVPGVITVVIAMPAPSLCVLLAEQYGADRVFASKVVIMTSMFCMATLPLVSFLF